MTSCGRSRARTSCWVIVEAPRELPVDALSATAAMIAAGSKPSFVQKVRSSADRAVAPDLGPAMGDPVAGVAGRETDGGPASRGSRATRRLRATGRSGAFGQGGGILDLVHDRSIAAASSRPDCLAPRLPCRTVTQVEWSRANGAGPHRRPRRGVVVQARLHCSFKRA